MASEHGPSVLVIDDQEANLRMLAALLTRWRGKLDLAGVG